MEEIKKVVVDAWNKNKKVILQVVGVTSLVIGLLLVPLPLIPGWPFLVFGSFCLRLAAEEHWEKSPKSA